MGWDSGDVVDNFFCSIVDLRRLVLLDMYPGVPFASGFLSIKEVRLTTMVNVRMQT